MYTVPPFRNLYERGVAFCASNGLNCADVMDLDCAILKIKMQNKNHYANMKFTILNVRRKSRQTVQLY